MKKLLVITLGVVFLFACNQDENDLSNSNLNGKIKSTKEKYYDAKDSFSGIAIGDLKFSYETFYNKQGNKTEEIYYNANGEAQGPVKYGYNDDQKLIWIKNYSDQGIVYLENQFVYDEAGKLIFLINLNDGKFSSKGQRIYNKEGTLVIESRLYTDEAMQNISSSSLYSYDSKGNNTEIKSYDATGKLTGRITMLYDKNNFIIEYDSYSASDELVEKVLLENDKYGNITGIAQYDSKGGLNNQSTTEYEYDKKGNWIKSIERTNSEIKSVTEREIVYY